jgi:hypothetical protein
MRKEADLHMADRIRLSISGANALMAAYEGYIKSETLCTEVAPALSQPLVRREVGLEAGPAIVALERAG